MLFGATCRSCSASAASLRSTASSAPQWGTPTTSSWVGCWVPAALGKCVVGYRLPEMLISEVVAAAGMVLFPGFAVLDRNAVRRAVIATCRYTLLLGFPIAVALITLAHPLVSALFGSRWRGAAPVIQILTVAFVGLPVSRVMGSAYLATKRVDVLLKLAVPQGLLLVALLAIFTKHGIAAAAGCQAVARGTFVPIGLMCPPGCLGSGCENSGARSGPRSWHPRAWQP